MNNTSRSEEKFFVEAVDLGGIDVLEEDFVPGCTGCGCTCGGGGNNYDLEED